MREIKFRAWDYEDKKIIDWGTFIFRNTSMGILDYNHAKTWGANLEVMQFTGLLDKNGKEIYEGDIVKAKFKSIGDFYNVEVKFVTGCFMIGACALYNYAWNNDNKDFFGSLMGEKEIKEWNEFRSCEIIGNIYENPEILSKEA